MGDGSDQPQPAVTIGGEDIPTGVVVAGIVVIALGVAGFWVLANNTGTGDVETDDVRARFRSFVEAVADGDGEGACAMMVDETATAFAERAALILGVEDPSCVEMVAAFAAERTPEASTSVRGIAIVDVRLPEADVEPPAPPSRAEVDISEGTVVLEREEGCAGSPACWSVSDGGPVFRLADPTGEGG